MEAFLKVFYKTQFLFNNNGDDEKFDTELN